MPLYLDDIRAEFAKFLSANPETRFSMDKALAHVVTLAYQEGIKEGLKSVENKHDTTQAT